MKDTFDITNINLHFCVQQVDIVRIYMNILRARNNLIKYDFRTFS